MSPQPLLAHLLPLAWDAGRARRHWERDVSGVGVGGHALLAVGAADPAPVGVDAVGRVWADVVVVVVAAGVLGPCVLRLLPRV
jgi:hypothetical protein